jgi:ankyrin repeat protein
LHEASASANDTTGTSNANVARWLIAQGADVRATDSQGLTPLGSAQGRNDQDRDELVRLLVTSGADVNSVDWRGEPVLLRVVRNAALVEFLLERGANVDASAPSGETPLLKATASGWFDSVKVLVAHGADRNPHHASGQAVWKAAAALEPGLRERMLELLRGGQR